MKILATEATRTAINSEEFRKEVERVTGWEVGLLSHEEEGRVGALGAGSSLGEVEGLVCDLGGESALFLALWLEGVGEGVGKRV